MDKPHVETTTIIERLVQLLTETPGRHATDLAKALGLSKSDINPILYRESRFVRNDESKPRWYVRDSESGPTNVRPPNVVQWTRSPSTEVLEPWIDDETTDTPFDPEALARFTKFASTPRPPVLETPLLSSGPPQLYVWQQEALQRWRDNRYRGIIDAVTGAGKTRLAVAAIDEHQKSGGKTVVLVPTIVLLHQWVAVLDGALPGVRIGRVGDGLHDDLDRNDVIVSVIASARNRAFLLRGAAGLLVVDECHRSASDKNQEALDDRFERRLGLSATHERLDSAHETVLLPYFNRVVYTLTYERAIEDGVIANVRAAFVGVSFTDEEMQQYQKIAKNLTTTRRTLIRTFGCRAAPFSLFLDDVLRLTRSGPMKASMAANRWLTLWREKKALLAETPAKIEAITALTATFDDADRTLLFTQSIASANALALSLTEGGRPTKAHHSDLSTDERDEIMNAFADGRVRILASVQTLEEGVDVPEADVAVIVASSKQRRQMIQRMGRVMRRKTDGRDARFIILFVKDTDEDPRLGAHELFVDELVAVARESAIFETSQSAQLLTFMDPLRLE